MWSCIHALPERICSQLTIWGITIKTLAVSGNLSNWMRAQLHRSSNIWNPFRRQKSTMHRRAATTLLLCWCWGRETIFRCTGRTFTSRVYLFGFSLLLKKCLRVNGELRPDMSACYFHSVMHCTTVTLHFNRKHFTFHSILLHLCDRCNWKMLFRYY